MTENVQKPKQLTGDESIISDLIKDLPGQEEVNVKLPSLNKFYSSVKSSKSVTLRSMTFEDEKNIASNKNANSDIINVLLTRCLSHIDVEELLLVDKLFLIMKLREISYGNEYKVNLTCPQCRKENKVTIDLSQLNVRFMEEDITNPVELHLPVLNKLIKVNLPRIRDEAYLQNVDITASNMWRFVEEIDGHTKKTIISGVLKHLPIKDMHTILGVLNSEDYGLDPNVRFACNYCSHHESVVLPITSDFFTGN